MISRIGAKEFKSRIKATLMKIDGNIEENDLYFSQTASGYYMEYKPEYPNRSDADFIVYQDLAGSISVHGNIKALVPTIQHYDDIDDFEGATTMNKDTIIYNLILMLSESREEDIKDKHFINYICEQAYLPESEYRRILKDLLEG